MIAHHLRHVWLAAALVLALVVLFGSTRVAQAHEVRPASLELVELDDTSYEVTWQRPARGRAALGLAPVFPPDCGVVTSSSQAWSSRVIDRATIECEQSLSGREVHIEGLELTLTDALVTVRLRSGETHTQLLRGDAPNFEVARAPTIGEIAGDYFVLGVEHILLGVDHLLFVLGLVLLSSHWRELVPTITAFTIAHSVTLALASLGLIHVPQGPVEAIIALSIVFLASEYLRELDGEDTWTTRHPWSVSLVVGLLHGLGFAGALAEVGLPQSEIPLALLTFNLGVEVGQLLFVALALGVLTWARRRVDGPARRAGLVAGYSMGAVAGYWFVARMAALF